MDWFVGVVRPLFSLLLGGFRCLVEDLLELEDGIVLCMYWATSLNFGRSRLWSATAVERLEGEEPADGLSSSNKWLLRAGTPTVFSAESELEAGKAFVLWVFTGDTDLNEALFLCPEDLIE